jgi:hypothetical protein
MMAQLQKTLNLTAIVEDLQTWKGRYMASSVLMDAHV